MNYTYRLDDTEEIKRLQTLLSYNILDTPPQEDFDGLVNLISLVCNTPIAIISMIDDKRQWYKAKTGLSQNEVPRTETFCQYTLEQNDILEIPDARRDERVKNNPHVLAEDGIKYYAGVNLKASNGYKIGTVCIVDTKPRKLNEEQKQALRLIADQTMILLEARKKNKELSDELDVILNKKIKETQRQLLQKKSEYTLLLHAIRKSSAVIEFSPDGVIQSINDKFLNIVGYSRQEVLGEKHTILLDDDQSEINAEFWANLKNGKFQSGRLKRRHKDGSTVWLQATYNPIADHHNKVTRIIKIAQDITKEIEAETALKKSKELAENLNIQKDNFIANMSHEIRTPIHAILGFTELLLEQEQDFTKKSYLKSVRTAGDNLLFIINDILDLSKIEAGVILLEKEPFNLLLVVNNVFSILHLKAHQKKIFFRNHIHPEVTTTLVGDKNRLAQILINLLGNAIKFTTSGSVDLFVDPLKMEGRKTILQFKVVDTGIGIPESKMDFIFDRFSQAEQDTTRKYGGTGLGLNISRRLIEKQGGSIRVESEEGKGSVFSFDLPFSIGKEENKSEKVVPAAVFRKSNGTKILLCEDNELNQSLIKAILTDRGYSIDLAENGEKGVKYLQTNFYDLVLMDIQMPIMDGYEATQKIRQEIKSTVPIIALTANFMIAEKEKCRLIGMNDYLSKPFLKEDLLEKVDFWVNRSEQKPEKAEKIEVIETLEKNVLSLEILEELSGGNREFQIEMISLFLQQAEEMYDDIRKYSEAKDLLGIKFTAHKLKTSFGIIGADDKLLRELEIVSEDLLNITNYDQTIASLGQQLEKIFSILNDIIYTPPNHEDPTN